MQTQNATSSSARGHVFRLIIRSLNSTLYVGTENPTLWTMTGLATLPIRRDNLRKSYLSLYLIDK